MPNLTLRTIDAARVRERPYCLWDDRLKGFGVRVMPSGTKTFLVVYRNATGRQRWHKIARCGVMTPDQARERARILLGRVAEGEDPADGRIAEREASTVGDLLDRYEREHVRVRNKASTAAEISRLLKVELKDHELARRKAIDVSRGDIKALHDGMADTPRQANFVLAILAKAFALAEDWGIRSPGSNPCRAIEKFAEVSRQRFYSPDELSRLGTAIAAAQRGGRETDEALNAIVLLALTGARLGEIRKLRWVDVDFDASLIRLPDSKTGPRSLVLGRAVMELLRSLSPGRSAEWVLPSRDPLEPISDSTIEKTWSRLRKSAELSNARLHDLRHTVGTYAAQGGTSAFLIRDKLGHSTVRMTDRYVNQNIKPLRELSDRLEGQISKAMATRSRRRRQKV